MLVYYFNISYVNCFYNLCSFAQIYRQQIIVQNISKALAKSNFSTYRTYTY